MASSSSKSPLLKHQPGYGPDDIPDEASITGKTSGDSHMPPRLRYLSLALQLVMRVLAFWGLVSLGLQVSRGFLTSSSPPQTPFRSLLSHPNDKTQHKMDVYRPATLPAGLNLCDCGSTIREARVRECKYDALSTAWLPPYCRDDELTAEFEKAGPGPNGSWEYFADEEGKRPLSMEQVAALGEVGGSFWASRDWHIVHCLFYWQKYTRMRDTNIVMEERFDSLHHVKHCGRLIRNPTPDHFFLIEVPVTMNSSKDV
ncbi:hypothetical protein QBC47DRAFT_390245 [Echria macrotheca]|uniref:Uncharacterized protein n=1 Tax=Echria macrotheca TaxID=438768 RepID=A0AAJ0F8N7_9PEZI|nr:hypothetical protein QBC47DRAFT_390245 [Echria macrotheca]